MTKASGVSESRESRSLGSLGVSNCKLYYSHWYFNSTGLSENLNKCVLLLSFTRTQFRAAVTPVPDSIFHPISIDWRYFTFKYY